MATMLMQGPELVTPEKMFSPLVYSRFEAGRGTEDPRPGHGVQRGSESGRYRSRKGKTVQKKQPQRGLGVAQLEKIRLQEQSKHEAACLTSLQYLRGMPSFSPSVIVRDQREGMFLSPLGKQLGTGSARHAIQQVEVKKVSGVLGSRDFGSSNKTADGQALESEFGNVSMPFTLDHSTMLPYTRPAGNRPSLSILISRQREFEFPLPYLPYAEGLPGLKLGDTSREVANISSMQQMKSEVDVVYELSADKLSPINLYSANVTRKSKAGGCFSTRKHLETGDMLRSSPDSCKSKEGPPLTLGIFDSSEPPDLHYSKQDSIGMPSILGISPIGPQRPKELSSFQNYPGNQVWCGKDKTSALKRKWMSMQEDPAMFALLSDSRAGIEVSDRKREKLYSNRNLLTPEMHNTFEAHYTTGIVRNALGISQWSQTKAKGEGSDYFQSSNCFSRENNSPLSDMILQSHVTDGDSSKSSLTTRVLAEDATFNMEASSGEFLALKLSIPCDIRENRMELPSPESACVNNDSDLKREYTTSSRNSSSGARGDFLPKSQLFKKLPSHSSPCQQPTSPSSQDFENASVTAAAAISSKPMDLRLKLAL